MKLENQVVSLELAKQLKDLGVEQESLWYWVDESFLHRGWRLLIKGNTAPRNVEQISAFTVAELGEMLMEAIDTQKEGFYELPCFTNRYGEWCSYIEELDDVIGAKTEADSRARLLIYLIENGLAGLTKEV